MSFFKKFFRKPDFLPPVPTGVVTYLTRDGLAIFKCKFFWVKEGHIEIDLHTYPSYQSRDESSGMTHWLYSTRDEVERMICFSTGMEPADIETAKLYFIDWCELTWKYICTGVTIDEQVMTRSN